MPVGPGVFREVVVNDQHVLALCHEELGDGTTGVRCQVLQWSGVGCAGRYDNRVVEGPVFFKPGNDLRNLRCTLPDSDIDTNDSAVFLVDEGVNTDRRLARCTVANDKLSLPAAYRDHCVHDLQAKLHRLVNRMASLDTGSDLLDRV